MKSCLHIYTHTHIFTLVGINIFILSFSLIRQQTNEQTTQIKITLSSTKKKKKTPNNDNNNSIANSSITSYPFQDFISKINQNKSLQISLHSCRFLANKSNDYDDHNHSVHTYIIHTTIHQNYNLVSHITYAVCIHFIHEWRQLQFQNQFRTTDF